MVGDHFSKRWEPYQNPTYTPTPFTYLLGMTVQERAEFDALKAEVQLMKELLIKAKLYDEANGEPNCEMEGKVALLKKVAEMVGVSLEDVFPKP